MSMSFSRLRRAALLAGVLLSSSVVVEWVHASLDRLRRIGPPDPRKYDAIQDARDWKNPYLIVRHDGIEILGVTSICRGVPVNSIPRMSEALPKSAWPYGLVVAVQEIGIRRFGDSKQIQMNREKLLVLLKGLGIMVDPWPS
jgi:hypothetical protein